MSLIEVGSSYTTDAGATVTDNYDSGLTASVDPNTLDTSTSGSIHSLTQQLTAHLMKQYQ